MSIKTSKIGRFSITFQLNEKKKVPLKKNSFGEGGLHENFCWKGIENNSKKGGLTRKGWRKSREGGCD